MSSSSPTTPAGSPSPARSSVGSRLVSSAVRFAETEVCGGLVLLLCTLAALWASNSTVAEGFARFWRIEAGVSVGAFALNETFAYWVNDGLMTIFFFVVGLEIKRELVAGELRDVRAAALPAIAALGGMVVPAAIYFLLQRGQPGEPGWGIPMATDIAFVVGVLALLGRRIPPGLRIMMLSLAIIDDIGAVVVIAVFYSQGLSLLPLLLAAAGFAVTWLARRLGVRFVPVYIVLGLATWLAVLHSGVHPTLTGVILGLMTPARAWLEENDFAAAMERITRRLRAAGPGERPAREIRRLTTTACQSVSVLDRLETALHPWVAYAIMPLFALANAGVPIEARSLDNSIALSVAAGLLLGKPIGIVAFSWLAVRSGLARLPAGVTWGILCGAGCLGGIGFTMSLFIANLGLNAELLEAGRIGVLVGSAASAVAGSIVILLFARPPSALGDALPATAAGAGAPDVVKHSESMAEATLAGSPDNLETSAPDDPAPDDVYDYLSCWHLTRELRWRPFGRG